MDAVRDKIETMIVLEADIILESYLKAVDSATDEDILTYESTTGDFEWHSIDEMLDKTFSSNGLMERTGATTYGIATEGTDYYGPDGTDIPITDGGTGSSTAAAAKAALDTGLPSKSFAINSAIASDDFLLWRAPVALTITDIYGVLLSGTNVIGGLDECNSDGANCSAIDADITFDGSLDQDDGSLTNGTIDAGDWIKWHTTSVSSPGYLTVTFEFTID